MTLLEQARAFEKAGKLEAAFKAFREAGALDDAARVLGALRKPRDAGQLLLESLRVLPTQVGQLDAAGKKRALMAAIFFGKAGENQLAVELFMALGEQQRAVEVLQRAGDAVGAAKLASRKPGQVEVASLVGTPRATAVGGKATSVVTAQKLEEQGKHELALEQYVQLRRFADAARCAARLGRVQDAAQLYADAGMPFEAADAYLQLGDTGKALDNLSRVPRDDARYRTAAMQAVRLALNTSGMDFKVEHFLGPFVAAGPQSRDECVVFDQLAQIYVQHDLPGNAREALQKIAEKAPSYPGLRERLAQLEQAMRPSAAVARQVLADHGELRGRPVSMPDLGALPDLDGPATMLAVEQVAEAEVVVEDEPAFRIGATIAGRYRLDGKLGQGGMATVWKAHDQDLDEHVALKVFNAPNTSEVLLQRFKQELKLSRQLQHPNIIRLYDIGMFEGHRYISMELLVGQPLSTRMREGVSFAQGIDLLIHACAGLGAAHAAGVVHRDVKPDNFFVTSQGVLKVMDFGIAKQHATPGVTVAGSIAGTPLYMSPEQISNFSTVTQLTDLYALGVCAYEMFTGSAPFVHAELVPLLMMHVNDAPQPPRQRNPKIPPELEAVILRLLQKDPAARFQSCAELAAALKAIRA